VTEHLNYINGEWVAGSGFTPNINPSDLADTIGLYAKGTAAQVRRRRGAPARAAIARMAAVRHSRRVGCAGEDRAEILARKDELGALLAREEGKTRARGHRRSRACGQH